MPYAKHRTIFEKDELDANLLDRVRKIYNELVDFGDMQMITYKSLLLMNPSYHTVCTQGRDLENENSCLTSRCSSIVLLLGIILYIKITEKYDCELTGNIIHIGLAHCGKNVEMIWKQK